MVVRVVVVVLLLGLVAVARPAPAEADSWECFSYLDMWLAADAIVQARVASTFRVDDETTGYYLDVTRVWKGNAPKTVTAYTGPLEMWGRTRSDEFGSPSIDSAGFGLESMNHTQGPENLIYYYEGYNVWIGGICSERDAAEDFVGSELAALRIMYYSLWGASVVGTAVLALILRAAWRRRAVG